MSRRVALASVLLVVLNAPIAAQSRSTRVVQAVRTRGSVVLDARFDEPDWARAPKADSFVQRAPHEGQPSTERSEVRLLYDDDALYVAATLYDSRPESVFSVLGRRDSDTPSDEFFVALDSYHDRRSAFLFSVTPYGVQSDRKLWGEFGIDPNWNAVWEVKTRIDSLGWYAEFRIPFSQLRFSTDAADASGLVLGVNFFRWISRKGEDTNWSLIPRDGPPLVSYYGELRGVRLAHAPRRLELLPYSLARVQRSPGDLANPLYRRTDPFATFGGDLRFALTTNVALSATLNPDFGQVEADPSEVNLSGFETYFAEQRPFFVEGSDLTQFEMSGTLGDFEYPFYSRRIGRHPQIDLPDAARFTSPVEASRILGAARISGKTSSGWSLGALTAVTGEERALFVDSGGLTHGHVVEPLTTFGVARLTRDMRGGLSTLGAMFTAVHRDLTTDDARQRLRSDSYVGGLTARHRMRGGNIQLDAWALASYNVGSAAAIDDVQVSSIHLMQRPDASYLRYDPTRRSLTGSSAGMSLWRLSGGPLRWGVGGHAVTPRFDMNDLGFQRTNDALETVGWIGWEQNTPTAATRWWWAYLNEGVRWNFIGERQLAKVTLFTSAQLTNFWTLVGRADRNFSALSSGLLRGGPSVETPGSTRAFVQARTDRRRAVWGGLAVDAMRQDEGLARSITVAPTITTRVPAQLELSVAPTITRTRNAWQYVASAERAPVTRYVVGDLRQTTTAVAFRANYTFSPTLTLQSYVQPFTSAGQYSRFLMAADTRSPLASDRFRPVDAGAIQRTPNGFGIDDGVTSGLVTFDDPNYNSQQLIANTVLRWEYRPGSTIYLVWSQQRDADGGAVPFALPRDARRLFAATPTNVLLVKLSYWMNP